MVNRKWEQVKEIFDAALQHKPEERPEYLDKVCANNATVRREVESLLSSFEQAENFMQKPLVGTVAAAPTNKQNGFAKGHRLRHYEIIEPIGAGGMGEVYLAEDTRLNRKVALKVLPAAIAAKEEANQRLWREARAAATLDHPHICAIHEIAEADGCTFIVMQYIVGETLADKLQHGKMHLPEILNIAVQVADALAEAHAHNLIHRDIKPANIMINDKGQAKVLDFGLAKVAAENLEVQSHGAAAKAVSQSGAIMGTVPFMSPEQVRGKTLDTRTDIFSFGATLYEMICGRSPFARDTEAETISAILRDEPDWAAIPDGLQPILQRALMKDANERYQTAADLLVDLQSLQKRLQIGTDHSPAPEKFAGKLSDPPVIAGGSTIGENPPATAGGTDAAPQTRPTSSAEYLITEMKRHKLAASFVLLALLAAAIALVSLRSLRQPTAEKRRLNQLPCCPSER